MKSRRGKVAIAFAAVASVLAVSMGIIYWLSFIAVESAHKVAAQRSVIQQLENLFSTLKDLEMGQRGYLLTGEEPYLKLYNQAVAAFKADLENLHRLARTGDLPTDNVDSVSRLAADRLALLQNTIQLRQAHGLESALVEVRSGRGKELMDQIRKASAHMASLEEEELQEASRRADRAGVVRTAIFIAVGLLNLGFLAWAFLRVSREMSRRDLAAQEISRQKELVSTTLASIGDGVIVTDARGAVTFLNPEAERLTGWTTSKATGEPLSKIFRILDESTHQEVENTVNRVLRLGRVTGLANQTVLIGKDGRETPIEDSAAPIRTPQGAVFGVVLVFRDFTDRKQAEALTQALNAINQELLTSLQFDEVMPRALAAAAVALGSETAAVSLRREGRCSVSYVHGFPRELIGAQMNDDEERHAVLAIKTQKPVAIDDAFNDERVSTEHMRKWGIRSVLVVPLLTKNETIGVLFFNYLQGAMTFRQVHTDFAIQLASSISLALENCRLVGTLEREVLERTRAEAQAVAAKEALAKTNANLEQTVTERTAKLRETVADLEQFSYSLAHDLRAPLRSMCSFSAFVLEDYAAKLDGEGEDYLRRIASAAQRMDELIQDVLTYSKVVRADMSLKPVDLDRLTRDIVSQYPHLRADQADIEVAGPLLPATGNLALLTQSISNLLGNAVKFVPPGVKPNVRIWTEQRDSHVRLYVRDNGIGVEAGQLERIWHIFERAHSHEQYPGTGIGLSIVKRSVEKMGGTVGVTSQPGQGSTFWFELAKA